MIYPENAAEKLGFLEIKEQLKSKCLSEMGRYMVDRIQPLHQFLQIEKFLKQTHEFKEILESDSPLPIDHIYPIKKFVEKAKVEGVGLTEEEFFQILLSLKTVFSIIHFFKERAGVYSSLETLFEYLPIEKSIVSHIEAVIDVKGKMKANASVKLLQLTGDISKAESEARKRMDHLYKNAQN